MGAIRVAGYLASIAITAGWLSSCATAKAPEAASRPAAQTASRSAGHIYVTQGSLDSACYKEVGEVGYLEPFSAAAMDPGNLGVVDELRKAAVEKYPNQVDAIINVHTQDRDVGSEVLVAGDAVQLEPSSKLDCKLPDMISSALANFATGSEASGTRLGAPSRQGYDGPAGTTNTAEDAEGSAGSNSGTRVTDSIRAAMAAALSGHTRANESALIDQAQLQQAEIKRLRKKIDHMVDQQCEAQNISATQCASMRKNTELEQPHEVDAVANMKAGDNSPSLFAIQNLLQGQQELIAKLREEIADMNDTPLESTGASPSN